MPIYRSTQYAIWCDRCLNLDDYDERGTRKAAIKRWRSEGWRKRGKEWLCPECAARGPGEGSGEC